MNKKQFKKNIAFLKENGISLSSTPVWEDKPFSVELETSSPAGEDMIIDLEKPTREELQRYIDGFDIDENVAIWWPNGRKIENKGLPFNSMSEQIDDYKEYLEWLQGICDSWPDEAGKVHPRKKDFMAAVTDLEDKIKNEITRLVEQSAEKTITFRRYDEEEDDEVVSYDLNIGDRASDGQYPTVRRVRLDPNGEVVVDAFDSYEDFEYSLDELSADDLAGLYEGCHEILFPQ